MATTGPGWSELVKHATVAEARLGTFEEGNPAHEATLYARWLDAERRAEEVPTPEPVPHPWDDTPEGAAAPAE